MESNYSRLYPTSPLMLRSFPPDRAVASNAKTSRTHASAALDDGREA